MRNQERWMWIIGGTVAVVATFLFARRASAATPAGASKGFLVAQVAMKGPGSMQRQGADSFATAEEALELARYWGEQGGLVVVLDPADQLIAAWVSATQPAPEELALVQGMWQQALGTALSQDAVLALPIEGGA